MLTDKVAILALNDLETIDVFVDDWRDTVRLRSLSAGDRDRWETSFLDRPDNGANKYQGIRATLVAFCVVNEKGERVFGDGDVDALSRKSARALDQLFTAAQKLNRLTKGDVEKLEGNSNGDPPAGTSSTSPNG